MRRMPPFMATVCIILGIISTPAVRAEDATAKDATKQLSIRFEAAVGNKASILIRRNKMLPSSSHNATAVMAYRMEVTDRSADGYRILWTPQSLEFEGVPQSIAGQLKAMTAEAMIPFEFDADRAGIPVKITNRERALEMAMGALAKLANVEPRTMEQVRSWFTSMDEATLAAVFAKDAALLAAWQEADLVIGQPNVFERPRANPFGGSELNATVKADVTSVTPILARIDWRADIDSARMLANMIDWLRKTASQLGHPPDEVDAQFKDVVLNFEETGVAEINPADGWTRTASLKRLLRMVSPKETKSHDESVEIKLTRDP
jgi:hypothetical protein